MICFSKSSRGSGLISAILIIAISLLAFFAVQSRTSLSYKANSYDEQLKSIVGIKRLLRDQLDCGSTLGFPPSGTPPPKQSCSSFSGLRDLKDSGGRVFDFGDFEVKGRCIADSLVIQITDGPQIALRKNKKWQDTKIAKDIFEGGEEFCRSYFDPSFPYTWKIGGTFMVNILWKDDFKYCRHKNPSTGDCSCPEGYSEDIRTYEFMNNGCGPGSGRPGYYSDSGDKDPKCAVVQYICISWN